MITSRTHIVHRLCQGSIQNGRDCGRFWCICVTLNQRVMGVDEEVLRKNKFPAVSGMCAHTCQILFHTNVAIGRILPSVAGCSVVLETQQPRRSRKGIDVRGVRVMAYCLEEMRSKFCQTKYMKSAFERDPHRVETSTPKTKTFKEKRSFVTL